jgi:hypothetical protein
LDTVIGVFSDRHCGSIAGLIPPDGWNLLEGGHYQANAVQLKIHDHFKECCERVRELRKKCKLIVVGNGDETEGVHHDLSMIITNQLVDHQRIAVAVNKNLREMVGYNPKIDSTYFVGGTPAHVSHGVMSEEIIAKEMGAVPSRPDGSRYVHLGLKLNVNGKHLCFTHKGPALGNRKWLQGNVMRLHLQDIYLTTTEKKVKRPELEYPDIFVYSHRHQFISPVCHISNLHTIWGFTTPSFQGALDYSQRILRPDWAVQIGMLIIKITDKGEMTWEAPMIEIADSDEFVA